MSVPVQKNAARYDALRMARQDTRANLNETKILLLYTGGTIGMVYKEHGYTPEENYFSNTLRRNARFHDLDEYKRRVAAGTMEITSFITPLTIYGKRIVYDLVELSPLIDSSNLSVDKWMQITNAIGEYYYSYDALIVLHGTDTMAYSASMLSFIMEGLNKPIILTGSQIPICEMRNDAVDNLIGAITIAGCYTQIAEVLLYFDNKLYRGNRTVKLDCSGLHAFDSPNYPPIATTGINIAMDDKLIMRRAKVTQKLTIHTDLVENIVVISMNPLINADMLRKLANPSIQAVVLQTYGVGNIPDLPDIIEAITEVASHCIVVNVTSCYKGGINDAYYCGRILKKMGVVSGSDMTIECTMVKLSYLLGKYRGDTEKVKALIGQNMVGELTPHVINRANLAESDFIRVIAESMHAKTSEERAQIADMLYPCIACNSVKSGNAEVLEMLSQLNVDLQNSDLIGNTPLHIAARYNNWKCAKFLMDQGVDLNKENTYGRSPLLEAIINKNTFIAEAMVQRGGVALGTDDIADLLDVAGANGDIKTLELLQKGKADISAQDYLGDTVAHYAARQGQASTLIWLNQQEFDFTICNVDGFTPLFVAKEAGQHECEELLEDWMLNG